MCTAITYQTSDHYFGRNLDLEYSYNETVTVTMLRDGQTVGQTVTYSVNSYIYRNQNTDDVALRDLLEAIYNYGCSAKEYVG